MTSYVMCNKKKLGIKKSDIECLKKSVEDRKLEYFKSELLKILDKKEKEESGEEVSKAFIVQELYKSMTDPLYMAKGGKVGVVGEIRTWNGKKYKKMPNKKWVRIYDTHDKHTEISIARLKGKVRKAQSVDELFEIVMNNTHRFSDENGKPLDIVLELKKEVDAKKKALNAGKPSTKEQIKKEQKEENKTTNAYGFTEQEVKDLNYLFNQFSNHSTRKLNWKAFNEQLNLSTRAGSKILHKITKKLCKDNDLTLSERASLPANAIHDAIDNLFMNYIEPKKKTITLPKVKEWIGKVQAAYDKLRSGKFYKEHLKREERTIDSDLPEEELKQRYKNQRKDLIEWLLKGDESYAMTITPYVEKYGKALGISKKDRETITDDDYNVMYHIGSGGVKGGDEPPKKKGVAARLREEFNKNTDKYLNTDFKNKSTGISAVFSPESQREIRSNLTNSKENGFTIQEHFEAANQIKELYENATLEKEHEDTKHGQKDLRIERFLSKEITLKSGKKARVCITVKHSLDKNGRLIYSIEAMDIKNALEKNKGERAAVKRTVQQFKYSAGLHRCQ